MPDSADNIRTLNSEQETRDFAAEIAVQLSPGDVIGLVGQLGAGKTHFTQGILAGLRSSESVTSPTFTLVNEYHGGRLPVFHFDFYRMDSPEEVLKIGWEEFLDERGIVLVEWANKFPELMPENTRWWQFEIAENDARIISEVSD